MRLDHLAFRTKDRKKSAQFFIDAFGYKVQEEFEINFKNGSTAKCIALEPPEKVTTPLGEGFPWVHLETKKFQKVQGDGTVEVEVAQEYHIPPEIFISDGEPGSPVYDWVENRGGVGGLHHIAFLTDNVEEKMKEWRDRGYAEFTTDQPLTCPGLTQIFTKPSELTGVIYEFIEREGQGFCKDNVKDLMWSTKDLK